MHLRKYSTLNNAPTGMLLQVLNGASDAYLVGSGGVGGTFRGEGGGVGTVLIEGGGYEGGVGTSDMALWEQSGRICSSFQQVSHLFATPSSNIWSSANGPLHSAHTLGWSTLGVSSGVDPA